MKLKYIISLAASAAVFTSCEKSDNATTEGANEGTAQAAEGAGKTEATQADEATADTKNWMSGIYFVRFIGDNTQQIGKVLKK